MCRFVLIKWIQTQMGLRITEESNTYLTYHRENFIRAKTSNQRHASVVSFCDDFCL